MSRRRQPKRAYLNARRAQVTPDPIGLHRLLRRRRNGVVLLAVLLVVAWAWLDHAGGVVPVDDDWHRYHNQSFEVVHVVDGDTFDLRVADGERKITRIRLWGVDTPELAKPSEGTPAEPWADAARDYTRERLEGQRVTLILQRHRLRGGYGRLLAYVELDDGGDLNAELIEQGLSEHDDRWSHDRAQAYESIERGARSARRGLWSK